MNKLILIGNGFDLAHKLKTSYSDFIRHVLELSMNFNQEVRRDLIDLGFLMGDEKEYEIVYEKFKALGSSPAKHNLISLGVKNDFFGKLLCKYFVANWVDIEKFYFQYLIDLVTQSSPVSDVEKLNREFDLVKRYLEDYLIEQISLYPPTKSDEYLKILSERGENIILNFNYTNTVEKYLESWTQKDLESGLLHIHGQAKSSRTPIIFGFGNESHAKYQALLDQENDEYIQNIKSVRYQLHNYKTTLLEFINKDSFEIHCIGHSLGESDRTLLREVFESKKAVKINMYYHKDETGYIGLTNNIRRINNELLTKTTTFPNSILIPQL